MPGEPWDQKLTEFLRMAGEELRRTGEELKSETQRLIDEVTDPEMQAKLKERARQLVQMAKKTAAEAAAKVQQTFGAKPKRKASRSSKTPRQGKAPRKGGRRGGKRGGR